MARSGMARVEATLALFLSLGLLTAVPEAAWAQSTAPAGQATPDQQPAKASKKKSAASKPGAQGADAGQGSDAAKRATPDPAAVQKVLDSAQKSLDAGKADVALNQVNALISGGGLETRSMARALAVRGYAYKKQSKPAQAIADLQSALWLKDGLTETERASALQARSEAYREAGLGDAPPISGGKANTSSGSGQQSRPIATATVAPRPSSEPTSGVSNFFSNLFGGPKAVPEPVRAAVPGPAAVDPAVSSWSDAATSVKPAAQKTAAKTAAVEKPKKETPTKVAAAAPVAATAAVAAAPPTAAVPASAGVVTSTGQPVAAIRIQLVAVRTVEEAQQISMRVNREFGDRIGGRDYEIEQVNFGGMGTFYRVRIGTFAEAAEPKELCASIRAKGLDCMLLMK